MKQPTTILKFKGSWSPLMAHLKPSSFGPKLKAYVRQATFVNARKAAAVMRDEIRDGVDPKNAPLTLAIKAPATKPLVTPSRMGGGDLAKAITAIVVEWDIGFAGLLRTAVGSSGSLFNLALTLHEGATIPVTAKMRRLFKLLADATGPGGDPSKLTGRARILYRYNPKMRWYPIDAKTTHIVIPKREFVRKAAEREDLKVFCQKNWNDALDKALKVPT